MLAGSITNLSRELVIPPSSYMVPMAPQGSHRPQMFPVRPHMISENQIEVLASSDWYRNQRVPPRRHSIGLRARIHRYGPLLRLSRRGGRRRRRAITTTALVLQASPTPSSSATVSPSTPTTASAATAGSSFAIRGRATGAAALVAAPRPARARGSPAAAPCARAPVGEVPACSLASLKDLDQRLRPVLVGSRLELIRQTLQSSIAVFHSLELHNLVHLSPFLDLDDLRLVLLREKLPHLFVRGRVHHKQSNDLFLLWCSLGGVAIGARRLLSLFCGSSIGGRRCRFCLSRNRGGLGLWLGGLSLRGRC